MLSSTSGSNLTADVQKPVGAAQESVDSSSSKMISHPKTESNRSSSFKSNSGSSSGESSSRSHPFFSPDMNYSFSPFSPSNYSFGSIPELMLDTVSRSSSITDKMVEYNINSNLLIPYMNLKFIQRDGSDIVLGRGSTGIVKLASLTQSKDDNQIVFQVAVKVLINMDPLNEQQIHQYLNEVKYTTAVNSKYVLEPIGICAIPPAPICLVLPLMECSLYDYLKRNDNLSIKQIILLASKIIEGLCVLFNHNVIQHDLKSSNILIKQDEDGALIPVISDFDLLLIKKPNEHSIKTADLNGTLNWLAPELLQKEFCQKYNDDNDSQTDDETVEDFKFVYNQKTIAYSFACILWSLLSRETPFQYQELYLHDLRMKNTIISNVINSIRPSMPQMATPLPSEYLDLILNGWDPEPGFRPTLNQSKRVLQALQNKFK